MRLASVDVKKLFGLFDHAIPLRREDRMTILFGTNGIGKTVVLRMIAGLIGGDLTVFRKVPFGVFSLTFENGSALSIEPQSRQVELPAPHAPQSGDPKQRSEELSITYRRPDGAVEMDRVPMHPFSGMRARSIAERIDAYLPIGRVGPTSWQEPSGEVIGIEEAVARYRIDLAQVGALPEERAPAWLQELRANTLPPVRLIETQRLLARGDGVVLPHMRPGPAAPTVGPTASQYSRDLVQRFSVALSQYAVRSQELDRTFPARLIENQTPTNIEPEKLQAKLAELEAKRARLTGLGFLDKEQAQLQPPSQALKERQDVLSIYAQDVEKKLATFDDLANRIELFLRTINQRFEFKRLSINREKGFVIAQDVTGTMLNPSDLSSGEQHELVLLYDLLFRLNRHSLVLIDEPEISLHVSWQQSFLKDLELVVQLSDADVVIATHAPEIISKRWPVVVAMKPPPNLRTSDANTS